MNPQNSISPHMGHKSCHGALKGSCDINEIRTAAAASCSALVSVGCVHSRDTSSGRVRRCYLSVLVSHCWKYFKVGPGSLLYVDMEPLGI